MRINQNPFNRNLVIDRKDILPVRAPSEKLQDAPKGKYLVKSVSSMPLINNTSKQEIRINYLHGIIQQKIGDTRYNHLAGLPKMPMAPNMSMNGMAPNQVNANPFIKSSNSSQHPISQPSLIPQSTFNQPSNSFNRQNYNSPINSIPINQTQNNNPFLKNQSLNNKSQTNQFRSLTPINTSMTTPGLARQTSFGGGIQGQSTNPNTSLFGMTQTQSTGFQSQNPLSNQQATGIFSNQNSGQSNSQTFQNTGSITSNSLQQAPGLLPNTPSFGTLNHSIQPQQSGIFGQAINQTQPQTIFGNPNPVLTSHTAPIQISGYPPNSNPSVINSSSQPTQSPIYSLDQNIKQLLQSKPNIWNILHLDPQYRNGFNTSGRMYVKSVLQRIIDQNILSQESLNIVIVEIYKQMYGAQNFEKILESKKKELSQDQKVKSWRIDQILGKQFQKKNTQSAFPKDFDSLGEDFYRSFKRRSAKFFDDNLVIRHDEDEYEARLRRKFYQIKKPAVKHLQLKVKFVEVKATEQKVKGFENPYTQQGLDKITESLNQIRAQHRKQIMPTEEQFPNIEGFTIIPTLQLLHQYTKYELQSVPKVTISNDWASIRFKAPINLLRKKLDECLIINKNSVQIMDEQWKVRDAQITFHKFADFNSLDEGDQQLLEEKIVTWCTNQKFELIKIDRQSGQVMIEI